MTRDSETEGEENERNGRYASYYDYYYARAYITALEVCPRIG